jgi:hypothetical protein
MDRIWKCLLLLAFFLTDVRCRKVYNPPITNESNHILAVDGIINTGVNSTTTVILTRSRGLTDSNFNMPEGSAVVAIENESGENYPLIEHGNYGTYTSNPLTLDTGTKYRISIKTLDGHLYQSDFVTPKISPPIDSLQWEIANDASSASEVVNVYVNTHDQTNATRFYRWDYLETWQHQSIYESFWAKDSYSMEYGLFPSQTTHNCWSNGMSSSIILGSTISLSEDVISQIKIATFVKNDPRMDIGYSMLVRQYPLDEKSYLYWLNVQKNSQSLGGLSDIQPSELSGNIHGITNQNDPVVGYITASNIQEYRLFIDNHDLPGWQSNPAVNCPLRIISPPDPNNIVYWNYPDTSYQLYYYTNGAMVITYKNCIDCRYQGGDTARPSYWPR